MLQLKNIRKSFGGVHARQIVLDVKKSKQAILELNNLVTGDLKIGVTYAFSSMDGTFWVHQKVR